MAEVVLIGFMGAGKTTVGKALAQKWDCPAIDTDEWIVESEKRSITDIFAEDGEAYFRDVETEVLKAAVEKDGIVMTGGGIVLRRENRSLLKISGRTIFLKCDPKVFCERIADDPTRPVIKGKSDADIIAVYESRLPLYEESANIIINTTALTMEETVTSIIDQLTKLAIK